MKCTSPDSAPCSRSFPDAFVGRGNNPAMATLLEVAADRGKGALRQDLHEFDLHGDRHVADLVEEDRPMLAAAREDTVMASMVR